MQTIALENKRGFTLIELVIVIVLIGILAATALPKFANLTAQARTASNQGVAGAFAAAVSIAHAGWIASGAAATGVLVAIEGGTVGVSALGWPNGSTVAGVVTAADTPAECLEVWTQILNNPPTAATVGGCPLTGICYEVTGTGPCVYTLLSNGVSATTPNTTITYTGTSGVVTFAPL